MTDATPPTHDGGADGRGPGADEPAEDAATHEARRRRAPRRVLLVGLAAAVVAAGVSGVAGLSGQVGAAVFLTVLSATSAVAGVTVAAGVALDQVRGHRVSVVRVLLTGALFLVTIVLLAASAGAFQAAADAAP